MSKNKLVNNGKQVIDLDREIIEILSSSEEEVEEVEEVQEYEEIEQDEDYISDLLKSNSELKESYDNIRNDFTNYSFNSNNNEDYDEEHELKVIYNLRLILNECEKLSKKTTDLKSKTNETSYISTTQSQLMESIKLYQTSKQNLNQVIQGIDQSSSILFLNKLPTTNK